MLLYKDFKSATLHQRSAEVEWAVVQVFSHSSPSWADALLDLGRNLCFLSNHKCTGKHEPWAHHRRVDGTPLVGVIVQPACLHLNRVTEMKSIVYLEDDFKSASIWCPRLFFFQQLYHLCMYWLILANQCMWMYKCFYFVSLSIWVVQTERGSVELSAMDICSSASSEQLHLSVLAPAHPAASQTFIYPFI